MSFSTKIGLLQYRTNKNNHNLVIWKVGADIFTARFLYLYWKLVSLCCVSPVKRKTLIQHPLWFGSQIESNGIWQIERLHSYVLCIWSTLPTCVSRVCCQLKRVKKCGHLPVYWYIFSSELMHRWLLLIYNQHGTYNERCKVCSKFSRTRHICQCINQ